MSIIYEALKKLEQKTPEKFKKSQELRLKKRGALKKTSFFFLILGAFIIAFFLSYNFFDLNLTGQGEKTDSAENLFLPEEISFSSKETNQAIKPKEKETKAYRLEGIIFSQDNPAAIINGQMLYEQDTLYGFKVNQIKRDSVELSSPEEEKTLFLD